MNPQGQHPPEPPPAIFYYAQQESDISSSSLLKPNKHILLGLITHLHVHGLSRADSEQDVVVSQDTYQAARMFIERLPQGFPLPKASPDGDGGLLFSWDNPSGTVQVIVDGYTLLLTEKAGRDDVVFHDPIIFDGEQLPTSVLRTIIS